MLKYFSPASWTLIFLMLLASLYLQAHKISRTQKAQNPSFIGASFSR